MGGDARGGSSQGLRGAESQGREGDTRLGVPELMSPGEIHTQACQGRRHVHLSLMSTAGCQHLAGCFSESSFNHHNSFAKG